MKTGIIISIVVIVLIISSILIYNYNNRKEKNVISCEGNNCSLPVFQGNISSDTNEFTS